MENGEPRPGSVDRSLGGSVCLARFLRRSILQLALQPRLGSGIEAHESGGGRVLTEMSTEIAFSAAVKAQQTRLGSRDSYERWSGTRGFARQITPEVAQFIATRTSAYLGTASVQGRPYIQHRGGPEGFLTVMDEKTIAFADYPGNRQYISIGNLSENPQAFLFLMDYSTATRIKFWGTASFDEGSRDLVAQLRAEAPGNSERAILFHVDAWDKNCRQHIPQLVSSVEVAGLRQRIATLEQQLRELQGSAT